MSKRARPAVNPITSHSVISMKARACGWAITTAPTGGSSTELVLIRDDWKIVVAFQGSTALAAALQYPGQTAPAGMLPLAMVSVYLRGNREQMAAFRWGQRVIVGDRAGVVEDIVPDGEVKVRLVVRYDDGSVGSPFTTFVHAEDEVAV
ncbi:hypothetical protein HII36_05175 [Nonomuraea sp. NN258]|uniref:hypothetical protein n=1 Tax=Nonomuraea antri TaxID=2730852 RepID=UPI0015683691|nr:hypothetical protein [Nonomuraea antri]NRQ31228.1 hypothetical protein [Nonomuraea antri]